VLVDNEFCDAVDVSDRLEWYVMADPRAERLAQHLFGSSIPEVINWEKE
jgi:hypothetical protein